MKIGGREEGGNRGERKKGEEKIDHCCGFEPIIIIYKLLNAASVSAQDLSKSVSCTAYILES